VILLTPLRLVVTKQELLNWAVGSPTGGPNGDGKYKFTAEDGTPVMVPSPASIQTVSNTAIPVRINKADIAAIPAPSVGQIVRLALDVTGGEFIWRAGNYAARSTDDPLQVIYIPSSSIATTTGIWERVVENNRYLAAWWGTTAVRTDNQVPINAAFKAIPNGARLIMPAYVCLTTAPCISRHDRTVHVEAASRHVSQISPNVATSTYDTLQVIGSGSSVRGMALSTGESTLAANEPCALVLGIGSYTFNGTGVGQVTTDMLAEDNIVLSGDSGIMARMSFSAYRTSAPTPNLVTGVTLDWQDIYPIRKSTIRNNVIRARKNAIGFYGAIDCQEYGNQVNVYDNGTAPNFSSGLRCLGVDGFDSYGSTFTFDTETQNQTFGLYYALVAINAGEVKLANKNAFVRNNTYIRPSIPFQIESWSAGSLTLTDCKVRRSVSGSVTYPIIRGNPQGPIVNQKYKKNEGFSRLHIARIDAEGGGQFIQLALSVKDFLLEDCSWIANSYSTPDGLSSIELRDLTQVTDGDGTNFANRGWGVLQIKNNNLLANSVSFSEYTFIEMSNETKIMVRGNTTVPSNGGGVARNAFRFEGAAGARLNTDGVNEQIPSGSIDQGLNYRYSAGARNLAARLN
jgi:hypothetical protein